MFDLIPFERTDSLANQFFRMMGSNFFRGQENVPCVTDIRDAGSHYELEAEMPGFQKEEIHVEVENNCLILSAKHEEKPSEKKEAGSYVCRERRTASIRRVFDLADVDTAGIQAKFEDGVLKLTLPKKKAEEPVAKQVVIE